MLVVLAVNSGRAQDDPITWSLAVKAIDKPLVRGDRLTAAVTATIQDGWHLYSTVEVKGGPKPTSISLQPGQPFELAGPIESPEPTRDYDATFQLPVEFYEKSVTFS